MNAGLAEGGSGFYALPVVQRSLATAEGVRGIHSLLSFKSATYTLPEWMPPKKSKLLLTTILG